VDLSIIKNGGANPKDISFKQTLNDKVRQLGSSDINYFEIVGYVRYHAYKVAISLNAVDISSPSSVADTASATNLVFLKILQKGKNVSLYAYRDDLKERFYIEDSNIDVPIELLYGIYQSPNSSDKIIEKKTYQAQLNQLAMKYNQGSDELIKKVWQSAYKEDDIIQIVTSINGNTREQESLKSMNSSSSVRFFAGLGFISNTVKAGQYYGPPSSTSGAPKITAGADLVINPAVGHLVFRIELAYSMNNYTFDDISDPLYNIADPQLNSIRVKQNVISITPQIIYNIYNGEGLKVFVDLGYCLNIMSYPPNQFTQSGGSITTGYNIIFDSKSNYSAFQLKAGVVIAKRFEIYGAYFPKANLSGALDYSNDITSYQAGLNYYFGKAAH
jgi:hypothetical protein